MKAVKATIVALLLCLAFAAVAEVAVPRLSGRVVDQTATLSSSDVASLEQTLKDFEARKGSQVAVLIVPTTDGEAIEQFSIRVAEAWKIGRKKVDDGAILVVAKNDRKLRIEVGYGLEGALNDATTKRIIDEIITPKFRSGDFAGGISAGVDRILRVIDGETLPTPAQGSSRGTSGDFNFDLFNPVTLIALFFASAVLRTVLGRLVGSLLTGGLVGVVAWFLTGSPILSLVFGAGAALFAFMTEAFASPGGGYYGGGRSSSGGWSGGGSGSSSGSGGGFSGGGGSFGGGGASGSW
jgi:uncharacterized protein